MTTVVDLDSVPFSLPGEPAVGGWRLGLIGGPTVTHSISPPMQDAGLRAIGTSGTYERWPTEPDHIAERITTIRAPGVLGANVTVPHKEAVIPHLDGITPLASRVGAVNTLVRRGDRLIGDNTDVAGFAEALLVQTGSLTGQTAIVLGAGGASRAVLAGLELLDVSRIIMANRTVGRAEDLIRDVGCRNAAAIPLTTGDLITVIPGAMVVVNATALGWQSGELPLDVELLGALRAGAHVTDLTYRDTDLLIAARAHGLSTSDGLEMLVRQGVEALRRWTGKQPPIDVMRAAAVAARA